MKVFNSNNAIFDLNHNFKYWTNNAINISLCEELYYLIPDFGIGTLTLGF